MAEWYWEFCERDDFIFNSLRNFKPVKRFQNRSDVFEFWSLDNSSSKSIVYVLETIYLKFRKPVIQRVTVVKFVVYNVREMILYSICSESSSQLIDFRIGVMCLNFGAWTIVRARAFWMCWRPFIWYLEDRSTESYSSQVWSVQWRRQLFMRCEGQGRDGYSGEHECDDSRI